MPTKFAQYISLSGLPLPNFVENDSLAKLQIILKQGILEKLIVRPA